MARIGVILVAESLAHLVEVLGYLVARSPDLSEVPTHLIVPMILRPFIPPLSLQIMPRNRPGGTLALLAALLTFTVGNIASGATPPANAPTGLWDTSPEDYCAPRLDVAMPAATPAQIVKALNQRSPRPGLRLRRIEDHRIVIAVVDADYLTQKMGSTGAALYLIGATYSLTSVAGMRTVQYDFEWGDHATPGVYLSLIHI